MHAELAYKPSLGDARRAFEAAVMYFAVSSMIYVAGVRELTSIETVAHSLPRSSPHVTA